MSHDPARTAKNTLKPLYVSGAVTKTNPGTPNLNKQKAGVAAARQEEAAKKALAKIVTADEVKSRPWQDPARQAYNQAAHLGGVAASLAFRTADARASC